MLSNATEVSLVQLAAGLEAMLIVAPARSCHATAVGAKRDLRTDRVQVTLCHNLQVAANAYLAKLAANAAVLLCVPADRTALHLPRVP